eukprot:3723392-Prymnesium_polylepis.1
MKLSMNSHIDPRVLGAHQPPGSSLLHGVPRRHSSAAAPRSVQSFLATCFHGVRVGFVVHERHCGRRARARVSATQGLQAGARRARCREAEVGPRRLVANGAHEGAQARAARQAQPRATATALHDARAHCGAFADQRAQPEACGGEKVGGARRAVAVAADGWAAGRSGGGDVTRLVPPHVRRQARPRLSGHLLRVLEPSAPRK